MTLMQGHSLDMFILPNSLKENNNDITEEREDAPLNLEILRNIFILKR